jgi:hypothetical protein
MDKTTKVLLGVIALGLWINVASKWSVAQAQDVSDIVRELRSIKSNVSSIESSLSGISNIDTAVTRIQRGSCGNPKIC